MEAESCLLGKFVEVGEIHTGSPLVVGLLNQHRVGKPGRIEGLFDKIASEELIHLVL